MQKVARTLITGLLVTVPAWCQTVFPPPNATVNQMRPNIGCDWGGGVRNLQLFIDGREWTMAANKNGGRIDLNPTFDVGNGTHTAESRAISILGLPVVKTWNFTISTPNSNPVPNTSSGATRLYPLDNTTINDVRPRISADFPENVRSARGFLDGQEVSYLVGVNGNNVFMTPQNDLTRGNHQVSFEVIYQSGAKFTQNWTFQLRPTNNGGNNNPNTAPQGFTNFAPAQNSQVTSNRPLLSADFGVVMDNIHIWVDKNDVTNQAQITSNRIAWNPTYDLTAGPHSVHVEGRQVNNNQQVQSDWQFNVASNPNLNNGNGNGNWNNGNNPGNNPPAEVEFGVDSPNPGDRVNGTFRVVGSATPDANVRVSVKPLPNKNKVAQFTGKADPNGNYNITASPTWATKGMRLEVTTTVLDRRGRPLADPIVITVIRR